MRILRWIWDDDDGRIEEVELWGIMNHVSDPAHVIICVRSNDLDGQDLFRNVPQEE